MYFVQDSFFIPIQKYGKSKKKDIQKSNCNYIQKLHIKIMQLYIGKKNGPEALREFYKLKNFVHVLSKSVYMNLTEKRI